MIDLTSFCSTDPARPVLHRPFSKGEFTYATDGRVILRVARRPDVAEVKDAPHAERIFSGYPLTDDRRALPPFIFPTPKTRPCDKCDSRGSAHDCPDCQCTCRKCDGRGSVTETVTGAIGEAFYTAHYLNLLATLPAVQVPVAPPTGTAPMRFTFDGGEGLLCGYAVKGARHVPEPKP